MALLKWDDEEEKKDDLLTPAPIKTVSSVQSSWQPTQGSDGADVQGSDTQVQGGSDNYLLSDEKAVIDQQLQQKREAEAAAKAEAARQAQIARINEANARAAEAQEAEVVQPQPKYGGGAKKNEGGVTGFFKNLGAGIQQGLGALGDIAVQGGGLVDYAGQRMRGVEDGRAAQVATANAQRVRDWLGGMKDFNGNNIVGTRDVEAAANRISSGQGNAQDWLAVGGKGLQAGIDATMFINPARMAVGATKSMPVINSATLASRAVNSPAVRYAARDAGFYGGLQGAATTASEYGRTGELDEALKAGATDAVVGGVLQGTLDMGGHVVGKGARAGYESLIPIANKTLNSLRPTRQVRIGNEVVELVEDAPLTPVRDDNKPVEDGNVSFQNDTTDPRFAPIPEPNLPPIADYVPAPVASGVPRVADEVSPVADGVPTIPEPMTEWADEYNGVDPRAEAPATDVPTVDAPTAPAEVAPIAPVADGVAQPVLPARNMPTVKSEEVRALQESRAGTSQAEEAAINQELSEYYGQPVYKNSKAGEEAVAKERQRQALDDAIMGRGEMNRSLDGGDPVPPPKDPNLPDDMNVPDGAMPSLEDLANRMISRLDEPQELKHKIANAVGMTYDKELPITDILNEGKGSPKLKAKIAEQYGELNAKIAEYNEFQNQNRKAFTEGGAAALNPEISRQRSKLTGDIGRLERDLVGNIRRLEGRQSLTGRAANIVENLTGMRNANMLSSVGGLERNLAQEFGANVAMTLTHPFKMMASTFGNGNIIGDAIKNNLKEWTIPPKTVSEVPRYIVGNAYRTAMSLTTASANARKGIMRENIAKAALEVNGQTPTRSEIKAFANAMGNEAEALVNVLAGVANGMSHHKQATDALQDYQVFMRTGDEAAKRMFMEKVSQQTNVARELAEFVTRNDNQGRLTNVAGQQATLADSLSGFDVDNASARTRIVASLINLVLPFVTTPRNLLITGVRQTLNPMARSLPDEILKDIRSNPQNIGAILRQKAVDYGVIGGAVALVNSGVIGYNDGDEVDKPRGVYLDMGDGQFVPLRAMAFEIPIAAAVTAAIMTKDIAEGNPRDAAYYAGMIGGSLPYVETMKQSGNAITSLAEAVGGSDENPQGDGGYAAKSYGVNMAKSFVPFSNNGINDGALGLTGESVNVKTSYDEDMGKWLENSVRKSYDPAFRASLRDSRDAAGRVRTADNQGVIINKNINDEVTKTFNDTVDKLVKYGRENGLGRGTQDMFNTYDTGKNNNFKSVQDTITFLDVEEGADGKKKPDNARKLENNEKLADLAAQIRDGFYGETGSELLTLDGQNLKSDASVPGKSGSKNSKLPLSMQSIKNAIAQTDLPEEQGDKLWEISQAKTELYNQLKAKSMSYDQYSAAKAQLEQGEIAILSGSESYKKLGALMNTLDENGFFNEGGIGSTKAGQTYLWNSLNALLGSKGATPAANYPDTSKGFTPWGRGGGRGSGLNATNKPGDRKNEGIKWTPVTARQMASVQSGRYTPVQVRVKLGNAVKKNRTQNYSDRSF